jgi:hypothetical protein
MERIEIQVNQVESPALPKGSGLACRSNPPAGLAHRKIPWMVIVGT